MTKLPSLAAEVWLTEPALQRLFATLAAAGGEGRVAGGAVRNALLGEAVTEVDVATTLSPEQVTAVRPFIMSVLFALVGASVLVGLVKLTPARAWTIFSSSAVCSSRA